MAVFVLDKHGKPLMPCSEKRARLLLDRKRARVHRVVPFVIRLVDRTARSCKFQPVRVKLDPGSKHTGVAVVRERDAATLAMGRVEHQAAVINMMQIDHRGQRISLKLTARRQMRRRRRGNLRYRAPRFNNRTRPAGWLAPSLRHRVDTTMAWVNRILCWTPVTAFGSELVRFDMQALDNPEIEGAEYQQGTLAGYEVREYLLEKWGRKCAYCDAKDVPLTIDHIRPKARGGTNRISNLTLACADCNQRKAAQPVEGFLARKPDVLAKVLKQVKQPLKDAAAVNATRWAISERLHEIGLPLELASGGRTKYNRYRLGIPKAHALDAACVGVVDQVRNWQHRPTLVIGCAGRGCYQRTRLNKYGFPRGYLTRTKRVFGFQTGDLVCANVPSGRNAGIHVGRVAVRARGSFVIQAPPAPACDVHYRYCRLIQRGDGYSYSRIKNIERRSEIGEGRASHGALSPSGLNAGVPRAF